MDSALKQFALRQIAFALGQDFSPKTSDENRILDAAIRHQCVPFLDEYYKQRQWETPLAFKVWKRDSAARILLYSSLIQEFHQEFDEPWIVLKGIPLAESLFGKVKWRQSTDLDILIPWGALDDAIATLEKMGFAREQNIRPWAYNQIALRHRKHLATVELHWELSLPYLPSPPVDYIFEKSQLFWSKQTERELRILDSQTLFYNLVMHFHQHFSFVKGAIDLAAWMSAYDYKSGIDFCEEFGTRSLAEIAIATVMIRGWPGTMPKLNSRERHFLRKRASISSIFQKKEDTNYQAYWKQIQNALYLDKEAQITEALQKGLVFGPHPLSDKIVNWITKN